MDWLKAILRHHPWLVLVPALLGGYWLLPISGKVLVVPDSQALSWPQLRAGPEPTGPSQDRTFELTDVEPWANVLLTVDGEPAALQGSTPNPGGTWTWRWSLTGDARQAVAAGARGARVVFYHDCDTGCRERATFALHQAGWTAPAASPPPAPALPTKLGVAFANPERDWHGRAGWDVDLTYARLGSEPYWNVDDLAARVSVATARGLRVLVRVDYDRGQSLPPADNYQALAEYLQFFRRLARDDRLRGIYGYVVGSGYNARDGNSLAPDHPVSARWYARVFGGAGEAVGRTDNVVQVVRAENPRARLLVGPVRPWVSDQSGDRVYRTDVPWLDYMNTLVASLDEGARAKASAGVPLAGPDGFALQAPGRPEAPELAGRPGADEPRVDLPRAGWGGAQAGFRVYRDWLEIVNAYPATRGLPAYITSANSHAPDDGTPPAQNYPRGWLTAALQVVDEEPQVAALCWFLDGPLGDRQWDAFSLSLQPGRLGDAAGEFDSLLRARP